MKKQLVNEGEIEQQYISLIENVKHELEQTDISSYYEDKEEEWNIEDFLHASAFDGYYILCQSEYHSPELEDAISQLYDFTEKTFIEINKGKVKVSSERFENYVAYIIKHFLDLEGEDVSYRLPHKMTIY